MGPDIGALSMKVLVLEREDPACRIGADADTMYLFSRMIGAHHVFVPILDPLDRPSQPQCSETDKNVLRIELSSNSESAADMPFE